MRSIVAWWVVALGVAVGAAWGADAENWALAFQRDGHAFVVPMLGGQTVANPVQLPRSGGGECLALSPADGTAIYTGGIEAPGGGSSANGRALWLSRPPYQTASPLPLRLQGSSCTAAWSPAGRTAYLADGDTAWALTADGSGLRRLASPVSSVSADDQRIVRGTEHSVTLHDGRGQQTAEFATEEQATELANTLRAAADRAPYADMLGALLSPRERAARWRVTCPVLAPSGAVCWFAANLGLGEVVSHNTYVAWFQRDLDSGEVSVVGPAGEGCNEMPHRAVVDAPASHLAYAFRVSLNAEGARWYRSQVWVLDVRSSAQREVYGQADNGVDGIPRENTLVSGLAFSPRGDWLTVCRTACRVGAAVAPADWYTDVIEVATGKVARTIDGASEPSGGNLRPPARLGADMEALET